MKEKMELVLLGYGCSFINILLIQTRFNIVGIVFGCIAAVLFIKAIRIKT